jgi:transcriptional regulator with XRE-family HTH domain
MKDNVEGIKGEYRELTPKEIGYFVRTFRQVHDIKRMSLAHEAGVSEKTLERLENGMRVSDEVYRKVAVECVQDENAFLGPRYIRTPEETLKAVKDAFEKWNKQYLEIEAREFTDERDMRRVLECRGGTLFDETQLKPDALDDAAFFKQSLTDWKDLFDDVEEPDRLNAQVAAGRTAKGRAARLHGPLRLLRC